MLITPEYRAMQEQFHIDRPDYGVNAHRWADHILSMAKKLETRSILDYGCGKSTLQKAIPFPIAQYDPAMPEFSDPPEPADLVVCVDVLEHIEPVCLNDVLDDLKRVTKRLAFLEIATRPAKKFLPDGRNAHLIQENGNWWLALLLPRFQIESTQNMGGSILLLCSPSA